MPQLSNFHESKTLKVLEYGETGTGKSIRAASAAAFGPLYIFDFDGKVSSVYEFYKDRPEILENISYDSYVDGPKPVACTAAHKKLREIWETCQKGPPPYATVVFDSWTAWEQYYLSQIMDTNPAFKRMKVTPGGGITVTVPDQADYRIHAHAQSTFLPQLLSLPMNVIVICHVQAKSDEITGRIDYGIQAAGKLMKTLPKFFGEVHRTFVENGRYAVQVRSDGRFPANTRLRDIPSSGIVDGDIGIFADMALKIGGPK